ncbi:MAG: D-glycerate dehydrogenase [Trueperaceae bacterium]|nr:D-glycerate dehydrogenase [Trueperaceae bacterium]
MTRVFVTRSLPAEWLQPLTAAGVQVEVRDGSLPAPRAELLERVRGASALVTFIGDAVDEELLAAAGPELKLVANFAVGYDNVDVSACAARGVLVSNTPDVLTDATADFAFALLLAVARRVHQAHEFVASGTWQGWEPTQLLGLELGGATLGIVGMGRIGQAVARRGAGFGMDVVYTARSDKGVAGARWLPLDELLSTSDFVSLHCPLTPSTRGLIGAEALARMKPTAVLVNTARGGIVDDGALAEALRSFRLWGAGLDVFEGEPRVNPALLGLPNVVLAPHAGSATIQARSAMARLCVQAVLDVMAGATPPNLVRA